MGNKELRKLIATLFTDLNCFYGTNVGDYGQFNYKVNYQIPNCFLLENQRTYRVEFDVYSKDSINVDRIADTIEQSLNYISKKEGNSWATFLLETRYEINEKNEYRRTLVYEVRTY